MKFALRLFVLLSGLVLLGRGTASAAAEADLLAAYDQSYASSVGGTDNAFVLIANAVASSNLYNDRSGTGARMKVVGYYQAAQSSYKRTSNSGFVGWMANYDSRLSDVVDAGNAVGADLVMFICDSTDDGAAAVAQQPGRYSSLDATYFYSVVLAHETAGHNYGRSHSDGLLSSPKTVMLHNYCGGGAQGWYTNPNIWINGKRLIGDGATACPSAGATAVNGGDNSNPSADNALAVAQRYERVVTGPNLSSVVYDWQFNKPAGSAPANTVVADRVTGTAAATVLGTGATFTGNGLRIPGGTSSSGAAYIKLPGGIISAQTAITVEVWATPLSAQSYGRVLDFNNGSASYLTLTSSIGTDLTTQRFESKLNGTTATLDSGLYTAPGVQHHYAVTYTPASGGTSGTWTWYRDGDLISYLSVAYPLSSLPDVNNWLGRSAFSADALANHEYAEVRVSNVALSAKQVQANYQLGPNYVQTATATLTGTDASGSSSFNAVGKWSNGAAPSSANSYETYNYVLRTPANATSYTFGGGSLTLTGGKLLYKSTGSSAITVNNLTLQNATVYHDGSGTFTLKGTGLAVGDQGATIVADNGPITLNSNLTGSSLITFYGSNSTTLTGTNTAYTGKIAVGNGYFGNLTIDSEARLGPNPSALVADQLQFNRGTLTTTATMTLGSAANRGIFFDVDGGYFNVATGTTLTLTAPISSVNLGTGVIASSIGKAGAGTLVLNSTSSTFNGTLYVDSGGTGANDGVVRVVNNQVLASAKAMFINDTNACSSSLQIDGSAGSIALPALTGAARTTTVPQIENLAGSNTVYGYLLNAGGTNHLLQADAGSTLTFSGPIYSLVTGDRVVTFQGAGNITTTGTISELVATTVSLVKTGTGVLSLNGACSHDGTTTLSGGTLRLNGSFTTTTGTTTTATGTIFAGTGTTASPTTINGAHTPGNATNSTGTQTFSGALTYNAAARLNWTLAANGTASGTFSKVAAQGVTVNSGAAVNLVLNGAGSAVNFTNTFWKTAHTWSVLTSTALTGQFALGTVSTDSAGNSVAAYGSFSLQQTSSGVVLAFYPLNATPPTVPTGLAVVGSPGAAALNWVAVSGATSYNVYRSTNPGGPYQLIASGVTGTGFNDTSAVNGTTYYYVITAVNGNGESNQSPEVLGQPHLPAVIAKADNATALNQAGSWTGSIRPSPSDTASWTGLAGANTVLLGANTTLNGVMVGTTGGAVSIGAGNVLTLGMGGIDMSAATQNLSIASGLTLGAGNQTWNVATSRTLAVTGTFTRGAGATLLIDKSTNTGVATASPTLVNGLVPWAEVSNTGAAANNAVGGYTFATVTGGNLVPYTAATPLTANYSFTSDATANYDISYTGNITYGSSRVANSVRHTGGTTTLITNSTQTWGFNGLMNAGTGTLTLGVSGGSTFNVTAGTGTGTELVLAAANANITIGGTVTNNGSNASSVTVTGPNAVTLYGTNTFTGGVNLNSGSLQVGSDGALSTGALTINGGTLRATGVLRTVSNSTVLNGPFTLGRSTNLAGPITLNADITVTSANPDTQNGTATTFSGVISGNHSLTFTEGANPIGTIILSGPNTHTGGTTLNAGTLQLGNVSGLGAAAGNLTVNGGALNLNAFSPTVSSLAGTGGVIANQANGTSVLTTNSASVTSFAGALQNGAAGQVLALTKQGTGTLALSGTSNYSGATTVAAGTLTLNGSLTGNSAVSVGSGATLGGAGTSSGPVTVAGGGSLAPGNTGAGTLTASSSLTLGNGSALNIDLAAPGSSARVAVGGTFTAGGTTTVNITALAGFTSGTYPLITGATGINTSNFALGATPTGYVYALNASNGTLSLTVDAPLTAVPTNLTATGGTGSVTLGWTALSGASSYNVKRSTTSGSGYVTVAAGVTTTAYTDTGLTSDVSYYYVVSGVNLAGEGNNSGEAAATALTASEAWRLQYFGATDNLGNAADGADPDRDGLSNLVEYALGTNPNSATLTGAPQASIVGSRLVVTFTRNTAASDVTLSVAAADSPGGPWTEIARSANGAAFGAVASGANAVESGTGTTRIVQVGDLYQTSDPAHPKRFLRLQVAR